MKVLITGGTGFIGARLTGELADRGHRCILLTRSGSAGPAESERIQRVPYASLFEVGPVDAVINLAGETVGERWTEDKKQRILESRVRVTESLVRWMPTLPLVPRVFLSGSAVGIYGNRPGEELTETSPLDPEKGFRYQVCTAWEEAAKPAQDLGCRTVLLRMGNVVDRSGGLIGTVLPKLRWAPFLMPISPKSRFAWISLDDAVKMILFALEDDSLEGPLNLVSPNGTDLRTLTKELGRLAGKPVFGSLPAFLARLALGEMGASVTDSQDIKPAKALAHGFTFKTATLHEAVD